MKKLYIVLFIGLGSVALAQTVSHIEPANMRVGRLLIDNMPEGTQADSALVKVGNWIGRTTMGGQFVVNNATVGISKAQLNTAYPSVPIGFRVICPAITLGGAIYTKATEQGTADV